MKRLKNLALSLALIVALTACSGKIKDQQVAQNEVYENTTTGEVLKVVKANSIDDETAQRQMRVGILLPLSGQNETQGKQLLDASQMAIYDLKADNITLIPINTNMKIEAISKKIDSEKVDLLLGPLFSADAQKIYPIAEQKNLCMISFSNDDKLAGKDCLFLIGVRPDESVRRVIDYTFNKGVEEVYAVLPKSNYGTVVESKLTAFNSDDKTKVKVIGKYGNDSFGADVSQASANILTMAKGNSALFIPESGKILQTINTHLAAKQTSLANYRLLGTGLWDNDKITDAKIVEGAVFASPPKHMREAFEKRFFTHYGYNPSKLSTLSYDAVALVKALSGNGKVKVSRENLLNPNGFKGITGLFRFKENGLNERALSVFEIKKGKVIEIDAAPTSF